MDVVAEPHGGSPSAEAKEPQHWRQQLQQQLPLQLSSCCNRGCLPFGAMNSHLFSSQRQKPSLLLDLWLLFPEVG